MVLLIPNFIIKGVTLFGMGYLTFSIYQIQVFEKQVKKLDALKQHRKSTGQPYIEDEDNKQVQGYLDNHFGQKILNRMQTQHLLEEQIQFAIQQKKDLKDKLLTESGDEETKKLEDEIEKMNELYVKVQASKKVLKDQSLIKTS